ncbi:MAG: HEAT repeat domain-containing protein [Planctomycetota bacterium]|nr:HEAT repeat domain-containing protein [Planctomycetota bacterium]
MRYRNPAFVLLLLGALLLAVPTPAHARGGRFSGPSSAAPAPAAPGASEPEEHAPHSPSGCGGSPQTETVPGEVPNASGVPELGGPGRRRAASRPRAPGLDDWIYWYEVNREGFEDLRRGAYVTEGNPLFAMGGAVGRRVGRSERRLDDIELAALRKSVRSVLTSDRDDQWIFTEGAAYIALGKIAATDEDVELITRVLRPDAKTTQYVRESAALGLGQLRRSEKRRQLPATTLDPVRDVLLRVLSDSSYAVRTRAFTALALGLLADQPSATARGGRETARALFQTWFGSDLPDEIQVGVLMGLGLHAPGDLPALAPVALQACVQRGRLKQRSWSPLVRAQAALVLGRLGSKAEASVLAGVLRKPSAASPQLVQAAALAAGVLGQRNADSRASLIDAALTAYAEAREPASRRFALVCAGRLLGLQAADDADPDRAAVRKLHEIAANGPTGERAFGALALGLFIRQVDADVGRAGWQTLRGHATQVLRDGLADRSLDGHGRAAFATALGLARDRASSKSLLEIVRDDDADPDLRAHAALALGLLGEARSGVLPALRDALSDARSDRLRTRTATAIGLLGGGATKHRDATIKLLIAEMKKTRNQYVKGQIAITLARIGDARAVRPLIAMLEGEREPHLNRALACAALGLIGDEERTPVLSAARQDSHYTGGSSVVLEVLDVL